MKFFISAGETSGDVHGAYLVSEIKKLAPDSTFVGVGSDRLRSVGVDIRFDISSKGTIGLIETLPNIFSIYSTFLKVKELLLNEKPDAIILIDSQGFNLPLAEYAKSMGIKTIYYIAPQEWLWGKSEKTKQIAKTLDLIIAIFPKEFEAYKAAGANVKYFGHPLLDIVKATMMRDEARKTYCGSGVRNVIALCAGSRTQEINKVFPVILEAAKIIREQFPDAIFLIPAATTEIKNKINSIICHLTFLIGHYAIVTDNTHNALIASDIAICVSGTINMEACILAVPNIMVYKLNPLTYWIGKNILKIDKKMKYFSMPNILVDEAMVPEFVQNEATAENIANKCLSMLKENQHLDNKKLMAILGKPPVISKVAKAILSLTRSVD